MSACLMSVLDMEAQEWHWKGEAGYGGRGYGDRCTESSKSALSGNVATVFSQSYYGEWASGAKNTNSRRLAG